MPNVTTEDLRAYLDEALSDDEAARVERALRQAPTLRQTLARLMQERDRGEHSVGAIWRRFRLSCPTREQLGSYLLGALDDGLTEYLRHHIEQIGCPFCRANLADLQNRRKEVPTHGEQRRKKLFTSSAGYLKVGRR
jgi:anti-sigma factor RsiW